MKMAQNGNTFFVFIVIFLRLAAESSLAQESPDMIVKDDLRDCKEFESDESKLVYYGWPFDLSFEDLGYKLEDEIREYEESEPWNVDEEYIGTVQPNATGKIRDANTRKELWTKTGQLEEFIDIVYTSEDVSVDSPTIYDVILQTATSCWYRYVHVNKTNAPEEKCDQLPINIGSDFKAGLGREHVLYCEQMLGLGRPELNGRKFEYTWYQNCTEVKDKHISEDGRLHLFDVGFEDGGNYACKISYGGRSRFVTEKYLCVRYESTASIETSVKCNEVYHAEIGKDTKIKCTADMGLGKANGLYVTARWRKMQKDCSSQVDLCVNPTVPHVANSTNITDAQCNITSASEARCYQYNPNNKKIPSDFVTLTLTIRNVKQSDMGEYSLELYQLSVPVIANFTLVPKEDQMRKSEIAAISVSILFFVVVALLLILGIWRKHDVMWYWKKHFGPYEKEIHTHIAYLAYYYDNKKMSKRSQDLTLKLHTNLRKFMDKIHGTMFDDAKDISSFQYQAEAVFREQQDCHRVIIVLTPEYITDHWSSYVTHQALYSVIQSGKKVIFIVVPGAKEALEKVSKEEKSALRYVMNRNITIKWNGDAPLKGKFTRRLEYALPKLPPPGYNKFFSTSSQKPLTQSNRHAPSSPTSSEGLANGFDSVMV